MQIILPFSVDHQQVSIRLLLWSIQIDLQAGAYLYDFNYGIMP